MNLLRHVLAHDQPGLAKLIRATKSSPLRGPCRGANNKRAPAQGSGSMVPPPHSWVYL